MEIEQPNPEAKDKLSTVAEELGHEIRVYVNTPRTAAVNMRPVDDEEPDDFYDLTAEDYFRLSSNRIAEQSNFLKTRKMREAEAAARRAKITKAVMRVRFPDSYILEATFHPSETIQNLVDLLMKLIARPDLPFYLYTVPPKERIVDKSKDFYSAGYVPGANIHFSYDMPDGSELAQVAKSEPYLREDIRSLSGFELPSIESEPDSSIAVISSPDSDPTPAKKKPSRPKWFKM